MWALASSDSELYIAGNFAGIGDVPNYGFAVWHDGLPPLLRTRPAEDRLVLSWSREFQNAVLEETESLASPLWAPAPGLTWPVSDTATNDVEVTIIPSNPQAYYRLRWQ